MLQNVERERKKKENEDFIMEKDWLETKSACTKYVPHDDSSTWFKTDLRKALIQHIYFIAWIGPICWFGLSK